MLEEKEKGWEKIVKFEFLKRASEDSGTDSGFGGCKP
jgi:hypothetical protein